MENMKKLFALILVSILLGACSARAVLVKKKIPYDPTSDARVRIYNENGNKTTRLFNDTSCQDIKDNPAMGPSKNPFSKDNMHNGLPKRTLKNISIGMPFTEKSAKALDRNSYLDTTYFEEKMVTANKKMVVKGSHFFSYETTGVNASMVTQSCDIMGEFTPEAGKDYEVSFGLDALAGKTYCRIFVYELEPSPAVENSKVTAKIGKEIKYTKCEK